MTFRITVFFVLMCTLAQGQILKKLKSASGALDNPTKFVKDQGVSMLKKSKAKMDSASFGFAIAFSDNAGLYENKEIMNDIRDGALLLFDKSEDEEELATEYKDAGEMAYAANEFRVAEISFQTSRLVFETYGLTRHVNYAGVIADMGLLKHTMGSYSDAERYTLEALEIRKDLYGESSLATAASLNNLAVLQKDQAKYSESEKTLGEAMTMVRDLGHDDELLYAIMLNNQAMLAQQLGRMEEASRLMEDAISLSAKLQGKKSSNHQRLLTNLAILNQEMGKYEQSEALFLEVIELKEKRLGKRHPDYAHMLNNLAGLYVLMERDDEVETLLTDAKAIYVRNFGEDHPAVATNNANLGNFYRHKNDPRAEKLLEAALASREQLLGDHHPLVAQSKEDLALWRWQQGEWQEAQSLFTAALDQSLEFISSFFPAMSESEKARYWDRLRPRFFKYYAFAAQAKSHIEITSDVFAYRVATKSMLLNSSQKVKTSILNSGDSTLVAAYNDWVSTKESLALYYTYSKEEIRDQNVNLDSLERVSNSKERTLSAYASQIGKSYFPQTTFTEIADALDESEALVEILQVPVYDRTFTGTTDYYALIVKRGLPSPEFVAIGNSEELDDKYFKYYRNAVQLKLEDKFSYEKFWQPIASHVAAQSKLFVSKDGVYNQLNIETLRNEGTYVFDQKEVEILTSAADLVHAKQVSSTSWAKASLMGFPDYGNSNIAKLPGTKVEVETIKQTLESAGVQTQVYLADQATEQAAKGVEGNIIHIATHGFFLADVTNLSQERVFGVQPEIAKEQPLLRSGLLFAGAANTYTGEDKEFNAKDNGVLTAYEAMNMSLENTDLIVLSACETGLGDTKAGEGVFGLQRAFHIAGADRIIMSLWKVDDEATQLLMSSFYRELVRQKDTRKAFQTAKKSLQSSHPEPYYWGAFVLIDG